MKLNLLKRTRCLGAIVLVIVLAWGNAVCWGQGTLTDTDPITVAVKNGDLEKVKALLTNNPGLIESKYPNGITLLPFAVWSSQTNIAEYLLTQGVDANDKDQALIAAAAEGNKDIAELLLTNKANVNAKGNNGSTPLHCAAACYEGDTVFWKQKYPIVELLLANKADVNARDNDGMTPLFSAYNMNIAALLLANGADIKVRDNDGKTPLLWAAMGHKDLAIILLAHGADIYDKDKSGNEPLHLAAMMGYKDIAELMLDHHADVNAVNIIGKTPLQLAVANNHNDIAELLRQHGGQETQQPQNFPDILVGTWTNADDKIFIENLPSGLTYSYGPGADIGAGPGGKIQITSNNTFILLSYYEDGSNRSFYLRDNNTIVANGSAVRDNNPPLQNIYYRQH